MIQNSLLLILQLVGFYSFILLSYKLFGKKGLYCWSILATLAANIEVLISIDAFGMSMTGGNILFATTFVVTDILSECYGKKEANNAVNMGIIFSLLFLIISQSWLHFIPNSSDFAFEGIKTIFTNTPRLMIASLLVYAIVQRFDVWAYHKWWKLTSRLCKDDHKFLWVRNNGSTLLSQLLNAILFTVVAFAGTYSTSVIISICISTYIIYVVTSIMDTPFVYIARKMSKKEI